MFLIERVFGQLIYCLCLFVFFIIIYNGKYKSLKKVFKIYIIILAIMGFLFIPPPGADLYRIIPITKIYASVPFKVILTEYIPSTSTPIALLYYYIIGKIGIDGLLPFITAIIVYSNLFYIIYDYSKNNNIKRQSIALTLFFLMSCGFFLEVISNIRTMISFSILARCFYNELYNNKKILHNIIYYIIAIFIHSSAVGIITLRFIYYFIFENNKKVFTKMLYILVIFVFCLVFRNYIISSINKFEEYTNFEHGYFWIWELIKISLMVFIMLIILHNDKKNREKYLNLITIIFTIIIMVIGEFNIFLRFNYFNSFMIIPIVLNYYNSTNLSITSGKINKVSIIFFLSILMLFISCARGTLSSLKFFILNGGN